MITDGATLISWDICCSLLEISGSYQLVILDYLDTDYENNVMQFKFSPSLSILLS